MFFLIFMTYTSIVLKVIVDNFRHAYNLQHWHRISIKIICMICIILQCTGGFILGSVLNYWIDTRQPRCHAVACRRHRLYHCLLHLAWLLVPTDLSWFWPSLEEETCLLPRILGSGHYSCLFDLHIYIDYFIIFSYLVYVYSGISRQQPM